MKNEVLKIIAQKAKRRLVGKDNVIPAKIKVISNDDSDFRSKVEFLLSQEEVISNPVHYLIDDNILNNMNDTAKERYIFSTLDKFVDYKNELKKLKIS